MNPGLKIMLAAAAGLALSPAAHPQEQVPPLGYATNFSSVAYFEPPHEQQVKLKLSGTEALPLPGTLFDLKQMKIEKFNLNGKLEAVAEAPQCTYAPLDGVASSPGPVKFMSGDGKFRVEGDGFRWQQSDSSLVISNHVRTVIRTRLTNLSIL